MALLTTPAGIKNRNLSSSGTISHRYLTYYLRSTVSSPPEAVNHYIRFNEPDETIGLLGAQASVHSVAGGITTFTINVFNSTASMLTAAFSLKGHAQEVVNGVVHPTNNVLAAGEVGYILITNSNNENVFDLSIKLKVRPYLGRETRL